MSENQKRTFLSCLGVLVFLLVTQRWTHWLEGMQLVQSWDVQSYEIIARAFPAFPKEILGYQHAQRFFFHYLTGSVSSFFGIDLYTVYRIVCFLLVIACIGFSARILTRLGCSGANLFLALAAILWSPYSIRYYLVSFGMIQDLGFILGALIVLSGLCEGKAKLLFLGCILSTLGRQTTVLLMPGILVWLMYGEKWRVRQDRILVFFGCVATTVTVYFLTSAIGSQFAARSLNLHHFTALYEWLISDHVSVSGLFELFVRILIPYVVPVALLLGLCDWRKLISHPETWASLVMSAAVAAQPFLAGPEMTGKNAGRLSALGLWIFLGILGPGFRQLREQPRKKVILISFLLALASLHHIYSIGGPPDALSFLIMQLILAVALFSVSKWTYPSHLPATAR